VPQLAQMRGIGRQGEVNELGAVGGRWHRRLSPGCATDLQASYNAG
jgi:hypothetical protein